MYQYPKGINVLIVPSGPNFLWQGTESLDFLFAAQHAVDKRATDLFQK